MNNNGPTSAHTPGRWVDDFYEVGRVIKESFNNLDVCLDREVAVEVAQKICLEFERYDKTGLKPNRAKQAGALCFWVKKLKPFFITEDYTRIAKREFDEASGYQYLTVVNEHAALILGFSAFGIQVRKTSNMMRIFNYGIMPPEIIERWVHSLRYRAHGRESLIMAFECFLCEPRNLTSPGPDTADIEGPRREAPIPVTMTGKQEYMVKYDQTVINYFPEIKAAGIIDGLNELAFLIKKFNLPAQFSDWRYYHPRPAEKHKNAPQISDEHGLWQEVISAAARHVDDIFTANTLIDPLVVYDISRMVSERLDLIPKWRQDRTGEQRPPKPQAPTITQLAGLVAYWIARLRPCAMNLHYPKNFFSPVNEMVAVLAGLSICAKYLKKHPKNTGLFSGRFMRALEGGLMFDMVINLRYKLFSVDSLALQFELLAQNQLIDPNYFDQSDMNSERANQHAPE